MSSQTSEDASGLPVHGALEVFYKKKGNIYAEDLLCASGLTSGRSGNWILMSAYFLFRSVLDAGLTGLMDKFDPETVNN